MIHEDYETTIVKQMLPKVLERLKRAIASVRLQSESRPTLLDIVHQTKHNRSKATSTSVIIHLISIQIKTPLSST